jgi:pyruvate formate lyase activating enzyme
MNIVGFIPNSFVDYPKNISAVIFTGGCNFDCGYCHNKWTINAQGDTDLGQILEKIERNRSFLDAVTISGGEPTLQDINELTSLIDRIGAMGLKVKLDTNGSRPLALQTLLPRLDYVAMDVKAPLHKYGIITPISGQGIDNIAQSIELIIAGAKDYEFRTTFAPELSVEDIESIAEAIKGAKRYFIQKYNPIEGREDKPHAKQTAMLARDAASRFVPAFLRGY